MPDRVRAVLVANKYHFVSGGAERYALNVQAALSRRGIEPIPLAVNYPRTQPGPYQRFFPEPIGPDPAHKIRDRRPGPIDSLRLAARAVHSAAAATGVRSIAAVRRPDVAYLLNINNHLSPSVITACDALDIPVVMRLSDFNLVCASNMYYRDGAPCTDCKQGFGHALRHRCVHGSLLKTAAVVFANSVHRWTRVYRKVDAFVAPSDWMRRELIDLGFPSERVHHIPTFVEPAAARDPQVLSPYLLFFGRFVEYKGPDLLLRAYALCRSNTRLSLRLAGDEGDEDARRLKELTAKLGLDGVHFEPFERDRARLCDLIKGAMFTVVPSRFYENLPNAVLESFTCGRPVIATRLGSLPEVVEHEKNGLLFDGSAEDLARQIDRLVEDTVARERMGESARQAAAGTYSEERHMGALLRVFETAAARRERC